MNTQKPQFYFLLVILAGTSILVFFIFRPFLYALILATVFATIFQPVYQKILGFLRGRQGLAALVTTFIVIVFVFTPIIFLGIQISQEAQRLYFSLTDGSGKDVVFSIFNNSINILQKYFPGIQEFSLNIDGSTSLTINQYVRQALSWLIQHLGSIFGSFARIAVSSFIFLISLYYLLKDGHRLKGLLISLSPLIDTDDEIIFKKLELAVNSVVKGSLIIAFTQGVLTAIGFAVFGVPNAVLWGTMATIAALIPGIGTALVITPAIIFLFFTSGLFYGFGLLAWGIGAVGLIDNFLGPKLVGHGMRVHPLIILLSVLGGLAFFGPIGFLLGPLTISLFFALLDIYFSLRTREN